MNSDCSFGADASASADAPPTGLSKSHNSPQPFISFYLGSSLLRLKIPRAHSLPPPQKGKRQSISEFSAKSRRRMMDKLAMTIKDDKPIMITLTYPCEFPADAKIFKRHLDSFIKRLRRQFHQCGGFWKLEFQKRGAPHYHMLIWNVDYTNLLDEYDLAKPSFSNPEVKERFAFTDLQDWVSRAWYEVVKSSDSKHLSAGTRVEKIFDTNDVMAYAAKYIGKLEKGYEGVGRFWGIFGRGNIPFAKELIVTLKLSEAFKIRRLIKRKAKYKKILNDKKIHIVKSNYSKMDLSTMTLYCNSSYWFAKCSNYFRFCV